MEYKLRPHSFGTQENQRMIELDKKRRAKVEKAAGKPFTDAQWFNYKLMTMPKSGNK